MDIIEWFWKRGDFLGKKIVLFFIFVAIVLGLTVGIKSVKIEEKDEVEPQSLLKDVNEIYRDELNISISELDTFNPLNLCGANDIKSTPEKSTLIFPIACVLSTCKKQFG